MVNFINSFDGLMLGDGSISKGESNINYSYYQVCKHKEWLEDISYELETNNIKVNIRKQKPRKGGFVNSKIYEVYQLNSKSLSFFSEQHEKWYIKWYDIDNYPERLWHLDNESGDYFIWKKVVPKDILLTPECVMNFYLSDGHNESKYRVTFATNGFRKDDIEYLVSLLNNNITDYAYMYRCFIIIGKEKGVKEFFNYISSLHHPSCYDYKFQELN